MDIEADVEMIEWPLIVEAGSDFGMMVDADASDMEMHYGMIDGGLKICG